MEESKMGGKTNEAFVEVELDELPPPPDYNTLVAKDKNVDTKQDSESVGGEKKENTPQLPPASFVQLFRFASSLDLFLLTVGIVAALVAGCSMPLMVILFGDLTNTFVYDGMNICTANSTALANSTILEHCCVDDVFNGTILGCEELANLFGDDNLMDGIAKFGGGTALIGVLNFVMSWIFVACLNYAAENQVFRMRETFLRSVLRQDIGWYDTHQTGDFAVRMTEDLNKVQEGIGEKIGMFVFFMSAFLASLINAFIHGWELTLVMLSSMPVLTVAMGIIAKSQTTLTEKELKAYGTAGAIAEEVLSSVRTVVAFGGQKKEVERYEGKLVFARRAGILRGLMTGVGGGVTWLIIYASYSLAFYYGSKLIINDREKCGLDMDCYRYDPASLLIVFFSVLMGAMNVGQAAPYVEAFSVARSAAATILAVVDRVPSIDSSSTTGDAPPVGAANVDFEDVHFSYPSRSTVPILNGVTLSVRKGETVALVGSSGCGKSTLIQLVQRFYDPSSGAVRLNGIDITTLNVSKLRERIGVVGQEPVLFGCSIAENIRYGRSDVTDDEIEAACKAANAYTFIQKLPKKYNTLVGERGAQLSGGQKQRVAIARALVRNPDVLLLDEATSALDLQSEAVVQIALDKARAGRTTIVVAHRLSTIRTADKIVALRDGRVSEVGTHDELMARRGLYYSLVTTQMAPSDDKKGKLEDIEDLEVDDDILEEKEDMVKDLEEVVNAGARRRTTSETRRVSISSALSDEMEGVEDVLSSAVAINRVGSGRLKRSMSKQESVAPDEDTDLPKVNTMRVLRTNSPEWMYILVGCISAVIMGASMPVYAILFGEVLGELVQIDPVEAQEGANFYALLFLLVGIVVGIAMFLMTFMFTLAGEHLTLRMRKQAFNAMLKQEMAWFDDPMNNTGALCSRLSGDAAAIQGATGSRIGTILQSVFTIVISVGLSIYYQWKLGLVTSLFIPVVLVAIYFQTKIVMGQDSVEKKAFEKSAKLAVEAIGTIRTVAGLGLEKTFCRLYVAALEAPHAEATRKAHVRGVIFGFAQSMPFFAYAGCMYYGGVLVDRGEIVFDDVFKVAEALILGTMMVGQATAFAPSYNKAIVAAARIFKLLDRQPLIDASPLRGKTMPSLGGPLSFKGACFSYPTRPSIQVLRKLDLSVLKGQRVALVGQSGCGKSTCIQLLQRFYDLAQGEITAENNNLAALSVPWLRSRIGIVSQEPVLFDRTLADNIRYGDNSRDVSMSEVIEAATRANIHNFIAQLPQGYETSVGDKGTQLSGGQKQRVAIARALIRNPDLLLLDEATSALDTESERVVQAALDAAQTGRTCITIAHRLSTIADSDCIFVFDQGQVAEAGKHNDLMESNGLYAKLWQSQAIHHT